MGVASHQGTTHRFFFHQIITSAMASKYLYACIRVRYKVGECIDVVVRIAGKFGEDFNLANRKKSPN